MPVSEWFDEFMIALMARCARTDWPDLQAENGREFWRDFEREMVRLGATLEQADEAASIVAGRGEQWPNMIRPAVVAEVRRLQIAGAPPIAAIEDARHASFACLDCQGSGYAVRYVHASIYGKLRTARGDAFPVGTRVAFPCSCRLGQLAAGALGKPGQPSPATIDQYPTLRREAQPWAETADGLDNRYLHRPEDWSAEMDRPYAPSHPTRNLDELRALYRSFEAPAARATASASRRWANGRLAAKDATSEPPGPSREATPIRPDIAPAAADPIIARELATATLSPDPDFDPDDPAANF
jgi:hypothetical protein